MPSTVIFPSPAQPVYRIDFISAVCNPDGTQTWTYQFSVIGTSSPGQEISDWVIELCYNPEQPQQVISSNPTASDIGSFRSCLSNSTPPPTNFNGIKWNVNNQTAAGTYTFTLNHCYQQTDVNVSIKTGGGQPSPSTCLFGTITGPSCQLQVEQPSVTIIKSVTPLTGTTCEPLPQEYNVTITVINTGAQPVTGTLTDEIFPPFSNPQTRNFGTITVNPGTPFTVSYTVTGSFTFAGTFPFNTATFIYGTAPNTTTVTATGPNIVVTPCRGLQFS